MPKAGEEAFLLFPSIQAPVGWQVDGLFKLSPSQVNVSYHGGVPTDYTFCSKSCDGLISGEGATNAKGLMDCNGYRRFAKTMNLRVSGTNCKVSFVSDDQEACVDHHLLVNDQAEISFITEVKPNPKLLNGSISLVEVPVYSLSVSQPYPASLVASIGREGDDITMSDLHEESENLKEVELPTKETSLHDDISSKKSSLSNFVPRLPVQLSRQAIEVMTCGFKKRNFADKNKNFFLCDGFLPGYQSRVLIKRFTADSSGILEAEKTSAVSMDHKYILQLIGYHKSENTAVLIFPFAERGSLDKYLPGSRGNQLKLTFQDKLKITIGIAQGVRYMHEECPGGPVVHGELEPSNIFLAHDLRPLISGFGKARWLHLRKALQITHNRYRLKDFLDQETMTLVKSDVQSFGVLLLRLFCRRSAPEDERALIQWARPFLLEGAFPELLDDDSEEVDTHGIYRVFCAAAKCTNSRPDSRPCMSEVISILKGEKFCDMQLSPSYNIMRKIKEFMWA